jgi:hypothetical protein
MPYKLGQNHDASRLAQLALFYDALVQLYLTLDSIPKLPLLGRQRCPDLVHPECGVARRQVWSEVGASVELRLSKIAHFSWLCVPKNQTLQALRTRWRQPRVDKAAT